LTTVFELSRNQFQRVAPLYAAVPFDQPCYDSVFEGKLEARIFVDDADAPTAALMCRSYEYFPAGAVNASLRQFIREAPEEARVFEYFYGYVPANLDWKTALLTDLPLEIIGRCNFQWTAGTPVPDWKANLPPDGRIVPIDRALAERLDRDYYPVPFVLYDWGSYDAYATHGFGFALLIGEEIASTITTTSVSQRHALVTIATESPFRKRGFAALIGARFVDACLERGLLATWDTDDTNLGSIATARRIGFTELAPFVELARPNRAKLDLSRGLWQAETRADGVTVWWRSTD
jgi:hypothetical protein